MLKLILKNLWARRVRNAWLLAELILVTVLTWYITDPLFVLSYNQTLPLGYEPDGLLIAPIRSLPSTAPDYNKEEADSLHTMENMHRMLRKLRDYPGVQNAAPLVTFAFPHEPVTLIFILKLCWVYITAVSMRLICSFLTSLYTISSEHEKLKNHPLKGVYQMLKLIVICIGVIIIISTLIDKDPMNILTGLGASAAILMLVFKDTIMGLVAGVQLSANNMLRPGDWITMPKYGADGTVIEVTLTTVKVQNWDNTITTIPPYALVSDSFQNWRGMRESGGRRIKRSLNIDMTTVHFCTPQQLKNFEKRGWLEGFERTGKEEVNLHVFRHYLERYLRYHPRVNTSLTLMVRQLQPTPQGLPIELYFFSANKDWIPYERLQAEVFDHVLAVLPQFGLKVFQSPTGTDILALSKQ